MAFTRQLYDPCATKKRTEEGTGILSYMMDPNKFYNCSPCRIELGTVGGNNVSLYEGNLVDLESEFRGQTRVASYCPSNKFLPGTVVQGVDVNKCGLECGADGLPCGKPGCRKEKLLHLPGCQIVQYKPRPTTVGYELKYPLCETKGYTPPPAKKSKCDKKRPRPYMPNEWQGQQDSQPGRY
jgi:hypothetical protein